MENTNQKKAVTLYILEYLFENASQRNPITQSGLAEEIEAEWGIPVDRKTVNRTFKMLKEEFGFEIESDSRGYWLSHPLSDNEIKLLSDAVMSSRYISKEDSRRIIGTLSTLASMDYESAFSNIIIMDEKKKSASASLFSKLDIINEAIRRNGELSFEYISWYRDEEIRKERSGRQVKAPVSIIYMDQRYYMVTGTLDKGGNIHTDYYALDKMERVSFVTGKGKAGTGIRLRCGDLEKIKEMASRKEPSDIQQIHIKVLATDIIIHSLKTHFGDSINMKKDSSDDKYAYILALKATEEEFLEYMKKNMNEMKLLFPPSLAERFKEDLKAALKQYEE